VQNLFKSVGLVARYDKKQALTLAEEISDYLAKKKVEVFLEDTLQGKVATKCKFVQLKDMKTDMIITIGGDGTILRTCINLPKPEPPILAVNMGVRGFLTEVDPKDSCAALDKIWKGEFRIEKCSKLSAVADGVSTPDALNDVVVSGGEPSKILYMQIYKDNQPIAKLEADGVIVATQTGSTGYSLSAGGPVMDPKVDSIILTPICSLTTFRSMVFPSDVKLKIVPVRPKEMLALIDGRPLATKCASLVVSHSKNVTSFIRFNHDFYSRLESRLLFKGTG
jgi:NAD+ kinase